MSWMQLGAVAPRDLKQARMNLHFAGQVVSGVGRTLLPSRDDDSHTNLVWLEALGALGSQLVSGPKSFRAALVFERFSILFLDGDEQEHSAVAIEGLTLNEALHWLAEAIASYRGKEFAGFKALHYEMPEHPLGGGAAFSFEPVAAFAELARWYANGAGVLNSVREEHSGTPVRCWPHHFDIATLITVGDGRTIGVGLSPGDAAHDEPYWYVGPWPTPKPDHWPALKAGGVWHTDGFVAAVLTGSELVAGGDQAKRLEEFLASAIAASRELLGAGPLR